MNVTHMDAGSCSAFVIVNGKGFLTVSHKDKYKLLMYSDIASGVINYNWSPRVKIATSQEANDVRSIIRQERILPPWAMITQVFEVEILDKQPKDKLLYRDTMAELFFILSQNEKGAGTKQQQKITKIASEFKQMMSDLCARHNQPENGWCLDMSIYNDRTYGKVNANTTPDDVVLVKNVMWRGRQPVLTDVVATND